MNRFAKMKKERIYTLFETLSFGLHLGLHEGGVKPTKTVEMKKAPTFVSALK